MSHLCRILGWEVAGRALEGLLEVLSSVAPLGFIEGRPLSRWLRPLRGLTPAALQLPLRGGAYPTDVPAEAEDCLQERPSLT